MAKKHFKSYGRLKINKLDWLLAIVCIVIAVGSLWISLGISVANAGVKAGQAFINVAASLGFVASVPLFGASAVVIAYDSIIIYGSIALLVLGAIYLSKKGLKDRIPGLVAELVAAIGFAFLFSFCFEYLGGSAKGSVHGFWPISLILFLIGLVGLMVFAVWATFNLNYDVTLRKGAQAEEEQPVEEQPEEAAEEPAEEPEEAPAEEEPQEEEPAEEEVEEEEELEEEDEDELDDEDEEDEEGEEGEEGFAGFGKRHKRVPFENKIRRASPETRAKYKAIVAALREYDFNDRKSIPGETFSYKKEKMVFITVSGSTLRVYFKLDPKEFEGSPIPIKDVSEVKKYSATPACLKVKSDLAVRRTISLAQRIAEENNVPKK